MASARSTKSLRASLFTPTSNLAGDPRPSVFRGENLVLRGTVDAPYFEAFPGNLDLNETFDLTGFALSGLITYVAGSTTVTGSGTSFKTELHIGQLILTEIGANEVFCVTEIVSDTTFICAKAPSTSDVDMVAYRLPQLSEMDKKRVAMLSGNAIKLPKGHIIAVGSGDVYVNGSVLPGTSLVAAPQAKAAIYRPTTNDYDVRALGFASAPPKPEVTIITGGTKRQTFGKFSFMVAYWTGTPEGTDGYSNPCEVIKQTPASVDIEITAVNQKFQFDFTPSLVGMPANAKGFVIYGSLAGKKTLAVVSGGGTTTTSSTNQGNFENGPWYRIAKVLTTDLAAGDLYTFDYLDSDIYEEVTGDNYAPPNAEFVCRVEGKPMYLSCYGKATTSAPLGSNPGPMAFLSKFGNPDGVPPAWSASVGGDIIGWFEGVGRWFLMTANSLEFIVPTGLPPDSDLQIISRPYWRTGSANRYSVILVDDTLVGFSRGKIYKSVGNGDETVKKYDFGQYVEDIVRTWTAGHVYVAQDKQQICFIHTASHKNSAGYWCSRVLPYSIALDAFLPEIVLSSSDNDMIVSGVATVDENMEFIAGGRTKAGTLEARTYRFGAGTAPASMPYYLAWQPTDDGMENASKQIHSLRLTGKFKSPVIQIHGARPGQDIDINDIQNGTNALATKTFASTSEITRYLQEDIRVKNLGIYTVRLAGTWDGAGIADRLDELVVEVSTHGRER